MALPSLLESDYKDKRRRGPQRARLCLLAAGQHNSSGSPQVRGLRPDSEELWAIALHAALSEQEGLINSRAELHSTLPGGACEQSRVSESRGPVD